MIVNRSDIINSVSKANNLNYSDIEFSIKKLIDFMSSNLYRGERIEIRGFGTFCLHTHRSRIARNPKTGEKIALERRNTVHFKPSKELKSRVNTI
ncbi:MAG: HU family DNA-binding protein [Pseudomonadota bacterium]|nr:HU family DNA-binding protein [Pseudomonadota bacterium]